MFSVFNTIGFCGSRSLPASARPLVSSVVSSVLKASSAQITVGCSIGADEMVLSSIPESALSRVSIFAAFGAGGVGACSLSAVSSVLNAVRCGASVNWWSGGNDNVPIRGRLARRSVALVKHLPGNRPAALVCFLSSPSSSGSLKACRRTACPEHGRGVRLGIPVFVFCFGFSPSLLPLLGCGFWSKVSYFGQEAYRWLADQNINKDYGPLFTDHE